MSCVAAVWRWQKPMAKLAASRRARGALRWWVARRRQVHLGQRLADALDAPFVELNREIERVSGCGLAEIHNLLGPNAYRRYERRAFEEISSSTRMR